MTLHYKGIALAGMVLFAMTGFASSASALTASCSGASSATAITWTGSASNGVEPFAFLWGNGATTSSQIVAAAAGLHTMNLQVTDASSTVATTSCSATVAGSATTTPPTGIAAQIAALLAQIKALQAQIAQLLVTPGGGGTGTTTPPIGCYGFWRDLKHGDIGDDVKALQQQLAHDDPTIFPPGLVSGFFGPKTQAAVKMWQRRYGIDPIGTGFFGAKSRGHLSAALCSSADKDGDGLKNFEDSDDDNDGVPDVEDRFPFNPNATTTSIKKEKDDDDWGRGNGNKGKGKGKGNGNDDEDEEDDD